MSNIVIDIAAQFTGKPAFKKADTAVVQLNKRTQVLGKTLTRTFGTAAVLAFGRASVKAFAEDNKAATSLGQTLKNLNLAYGSNIGTVNGYISRLEAQTGVLDDELRPAMDRLLRATGSVTKSQELLNLALDIAAGTGKSVTQVSQSLQKAFLGQTQALGRLGVGLTKAEIASGSFEDIQQKLTTLFAGQASAAADTFAGKLDKLTIASNNAKETIGAGLVDALTALSGGDTNAGIENIDKLASGIASSVKNVGLLIEKLEKLKPVLIAVGVVAAAAFLPLTTAIAGAIFLLGDLNKRLDEQSFRKGVIPKGMGNIAMTISGQVDNRTVKNQTTITKLTKEQAAAQAKILKDKKLGIAIDKANIALNKGTDVFDIDKIQNAAALTNQAQLLGKATNGAAVLQIANDTARLNVKKSILALEDAIASKDEAAIIAATNKLNADIKVLDALTGQKTQMAAIESILKGLIPKDLINQKNLDDALNKIREMLALLAKVSVPAAGATTATEVAAKAAGATGAALGGVIGGTLLIDGKTEAELAADAAEATAEAAGDAADTAGDAADTLAKIDEVIAELGGSVSVIGENGKEFIALIDGVAETFQTLDDSTAFNALVNSFAKGDIGLFNAGAAKAAEGSLFGTQGIEDASAFNALVNSFANGAIGSFGAGSARAGEGGSIFNSGAVGSRDRDFNINITTGIGDPNAIAEAVNQVIQDAVDRGTLRGAFIA